MKKMIKGSSIVDHGKNMYTRTKRGGARKPKIESNGNPVEELTKKAKWLHLSYLDIHVIVSTTSNIPCGEWHYFHIYVVVHNEFVLRIFFVWSRMVCKNKSLKSVVHSIRLARAKQLKSGEGFESKGKRGVDGLT